MRFGPLDNAKISTWLMLIFGAVLVAVIIWLVVS